MYVCMYIYIYIHIYILCGENFRCHVEWPEVGRGQMCESVSLLLSLALALHPDMHLCVCTCTLPPSVLNAHA